MSVGWGVISQRPHRDHQTLLLARNDHQHKKRARNSQHLPRRRDHGGAERGSLASTAPVTPHARPFKVRGLLNPSSKNTCGAAIQGMQQPLSPVLARGTGVLLDMAAPTSPFNAVASCARPQSPRMDSTYARAFAFSRPLPKCAKLQNIGEPTKHACAL